ncbi:AMP-binding protein [Mycobacterium sp.]|uniref:AMP-binding protein n=1 Tax=Mycobacterium sp. TaxID=1785 RepID=UPI003BAC569A
MATASVVSTAARAVVYSGLFRPTSPVAVFRLIREIHRTGANAYTTLAVAAARWPDRTAMIDEDGALRYRDLRIKTDSLAHKLSRNGVAAGQAVGLMCRNGRGFVIGLFAASLVGADVVLVNTEFHSDALAAVLSAHQIQTMVCDDEFAGRIREARDTLRIVDPETGPPHASDLRPEAAAAGRVVLLTSGTTGVPKGVPRTPNIGSGVGAAMTILERTGLRVGARVVLAVPMFHGLGFGILMLTLGLGGTVLTRRRFDAEATLAQVSLHRADALSAVPIMLARMLDLHQRVRARNPVPCLRAVICGGDRLDPSLVRRFMASYGYILYNLYGSTEVGVGALATPGELLRAPETVGKPVAGCPVRIFDKSGRLLGPRVTGRIFIGSEPTSEGYPGGGGKAAIGHMAGTGDMGYLDESGRLYIVGREDDMIVSGGENVYPRALENSLAQHPGVAENAVVGVPDQQFGHRLAAFIVPRQHGDISELAIREYLRGRVSRFEQPRDIHIVTSIPRNSAGKVLRRQLAP